MCDHWRGSPGTGLGDSWQGAVPLCLGFLLWKMGADIGRVYTRSILVMLAASSRLKGMEKTR